ncbi:MAG: signal recognition particle-docking protein FtsY [Bacilli bacterium]|nr:signal recognition particle-docking protein FtsY [Bacilli bacterium]
MGIFSKLKKMFGGAEEEKEEKVVEETLESEEEIDDENLEDSEIEDDEDEEITEDENIDEDIEIEPLTEEKKEKVKIYDKGLSKSRGGFVSKLQDLTRRYSKINEDYFDELEEILIMADVGVNTVMELIEKLKKRVNDDKITDPEELKEVLVDEMFIIYVNDEILTNKIHFNDKDISVILFVGVNGVGKTTTIAKIASKLKKDNKKVMLVAGDTFRAGAVEQLREWSERVGTSFYGGNEKDDPSSVLYDGIVKAKEEGCDIVLVDTAGRLQNKVNLMHELEKMNNVISKLVDGGCSETLLVIDATTGQNGISQAKAFKEITNITGIVLTKMDGTAKGGIVLAIKSEVGIPVKYIGLGEKEEDLVSFDIENYIYGLFKDMI